MKDLVQALKHQASHPTCPLVVKQNIIKLTRFLRDSRSSRGALAQDHWLGFSSHSPLPAFNFSSCAPWGASCTESSPASALLASPLGLLRWCCGHPVHCRLLIGRGCLSVSTVFILTSEVHLCVQGWRDIQGLSVRRAGLLFSIQTFFISRRVKIWPGGHNATNMHMLFKWFRPEKHMSATLRSRCTKLNCYEALTWNRCISFLASLGFYKCVALPAEPSLSAIRCGSR